MKLKKLIATLLSITMLLTAIPTISFADLATGETTKAKFLLVLLKENSDGKLVEVAADQLDMTQNFFVGLKLEDMDHIKEVAEYRDEDPDDASSALWGLSNIGAGIVYNNNYVEYEPNGRRGGTLNAGMVKGKYKARFDKALVTYKENGVEKTKPSKYMDSNEEFDYGVYKYQNAPIVENVLDNTSPDYPEFTTTTGILLASDSIQSSITTWYDGNINDYLGIFEFKFTDTAIASGAAGLKGKKVIDFAQKSGFTSMSFGIGTKSKVYQDKRGDNKDIDLVVERDSSGIDFFPADAATQIGISARLGSGKNLNYKANENVRTGDITVYKKYDQEDKNNTDAITEGISYWYGPAGKTNTTDGLTEITNSIALDKGIPSEANGKTLYVKVGDYVAPVKTSADADTTLTVTAAAIDTLTNLKTNNAHTWGTTAIAGFSEIGFNNNLKITITYDNGKSEEVAYNNFTAKGIKLVKSDVNGTVGDVPASNEKLALGANYFNIATTDGTKKYYTGTNNTFKYSASYDTVTVTAKTAPTLKYNENDNFDPSALVVTTKKLSESGTGTDTPYSTTPTDRWNTLGLKVVIAADANAAKTAAEATASTKITKAMLDAGNKVYVVVDNNGTKTATEIGTLSPKSGTTYAVSTQPTKMTYTYPDTLDLTGIVFKATNPDDPSVNNKTYTLAEAQTAGIFDTVKIGAATIVPGTTKLTKANSGKISFYKGTGATPVCESNAITVSPKTLGLVRDGSDAITKEYDGTDSATVAVKVNPDDVVSGDTVGAVTGLTFKYDNKNVGTEKAISATGTPSVAGLDANKYTLAAANTITGIKGAITAKELTITSITGVPSVKVGASGDAATVAGTLTLTTTNSDMISGDALTLKYKATYTDTSKEGEADVTIDVDGTGLGLDGADKANYTLKKPMPATKGTISNKVITGIEITVPATKTSYTYPDLTLDTTGIKVIAHYADGVADEDVTGSTTFSPTTLVMGNNEITATFNGQTAKFNVTAEPKTIKLTDLTFTATKAAGSDTVTVTVEVKDGVIETGDEVTITADGAFDDNIPGTDKPVHITNIALTGAAAANYKLEATEGSGTGEITAGSQNAPEKVEATVDNKTNNITVTAPVGANVEYSIDGGTTWQNEPLFTGLTAGTEYTVQARFKATASDAASPAAETKVTTFKYHVTRAKKGSSKILDEIYTSEDTVASAADMNSKVFAKKPSSFKAYFTDSACKEEVEYPFTMKAETALFYTTSGGGGGGGVTTYIVKFNAGKYGKIDNNENQNIESGKTVTKLPTVTPNDGYKFVGWSVDGGKTVIDPAQQKITKATTLTAVYEEVEATPVPTPIIKKDYTKPYASGYDDGMFLPNDYITRAELASMIARLSYGDDIPNSYRASFPDVDNAWYNKYIGYLEDKGVLSGYEDGTFRPNNTVTRGEMCAVIARAQKYDLISVDGMFADVTDADWAKDYITTLATKNIVSGYEDGTFGTYAPITRAETVAIINRVLEPSKPIITFTPLDIAGHWAEADIMLAVNEREIIGSETVVTPEATPEATAEPEATPEASPEASPEATAEPTATPAA